jgi:hypothetical protein
MRKKLFAGKRRQKKKMVAGKEVVYKLKNYLGIKGR